MFDLVIVDFKRYAC